MAVDLERGLAEHLGQPTRTGATLKLHLPQAILRVDVALGEEEVVLVLGVDVRHAPPVAQDLDGACEARDLHAALSGRQEAPEKRHPGGHSRRHQRNRSGCQK